MTQRTFWHLAGSHHVWARQMLEDPGMPALLSCQPHERPRERLSALGASGLSDAELLGILFGSGRPGQNAVDLASSLLLALRDLRGLAEATDAELCRYPGVGPARAAVIHAALELGRRAVGTRPRRGSRLAAAAEVWAHYRA